MIVAIEGIDGAGKNTLTTALVAQLEADGCAVQSLAFPRYEESVFAQLASQALYGKMGDLIDSAHGMATLFALDRRDALATLERFAASQEVLLLDRYVASNAAYSVARTQDPQLQDWIADLEYGTFGLPHPTLQVLLDTPVETAAARAARREAQDATRTRDAYENDGGLQSRTAAAYRRLCGADWGGPWLRVDPADDVAGVAAEISRRLLAP